MRRDNWIPSKFPDLDRMAKWEGGGDTGDIDIRVLTVKGLDECPLVTSSDPCWPSQTCKCLRVWEKSQGLSLNDRHRGLFSVHLPAVPC